MKLSINSGKLSVGTDCNLAFVSVFLIKLRSTSYWLPYHSPETEHYGASKYWNWKLKCSPRDRTNFVPTCVRIPSSYKSFASNIQLEMITLGFEKVWFWTFFTPSWPSEQAANRYVWSKNSAWRGPILIKVTALALNSLLRVYFFSNNYNVSSFYSQLGDFWFFEKC